MNLNIPTAPAEIQGAAVRFEASEQGAHLALRSMGIVTELDLSPDQRERLAKLLAGAAPGRIEIELDSATVRDAAAGL